MRVGKVDHSIISKFTTWFFWLGVALVLLGMAAISAAAWTTLMTVTLLGIIVTVGSAILILDSFKFWWGSWDSFLIHLVIGILYLVAGLMLIENPLLGSISITLVLGIAYTLIGMFKLVYVLSTRLYGWGWGVFNGLLSLLIGILILESWPASSLFILGLFVGIDLVFIGWTYIIMSQTAKSITLSNSRA